MKLIIAEIINLIKKKRQRNVTELLQFFIVLTVMITVFSILFHFIMIYENREFSWITGFYWTLTVMSTLGFGDITFTSDLGKIFSVIVLISGVIFLLTMLPFTLIQFFYLPWVEAQSRAKTPRELPEGTEGHVILTSHGPITMNLVKKLIVFNYDYVIVVQDVVEALALYDKHYKVVVGELDDPETYRRIHVHKAALVVANINDMMNTNIAYTVREASSEVPIVTNAESDDSVDILDLAGSTHVFQFMKRLGQSLARRVIGTSTRANVIGNIDSLLIAEAPAMTTPLVGKTLEQIRLREKTGATVVGVWERGRFTIPDPTTTINPTTVLLLAGSDEHLTKYDDKYGSFRKTEKPVLILGGGRVGMAAAKTLHNRSIDYHIIEKKQRLIEDGHFIYGNAADINTLNRAGIKTSPSILITTHDDPTNIYLTIYCRRLRPDMQIISRANLERNISKLHEAGADLVMSYDSLVANMILNLFKPDKLLMLAEGLDIFRIDIHPSLIGKSLAESRIRDDTCCSVIAVIRNGEMDINPDPSVGLKKHDELVMIGTDAAHRLFIKKYGEKDGVNHKHLATNTTN